MKGTLGKPYVRNQNQGDVPLISLVCLVKFGLNYGSLPFFANTFSYDENKTSTLR